MSIAVVITEVSSLFSLPADFWGSGGGVRSGIEQIYILSSFQKAAPFLFWVPEGSLAGFVWVR